MGGTLSVLECDAPPPAQPKESDQARMFRLVQHCEQGKLEALLRNQLADIDINAPNREGEYPLHIAARTGQLPICKMLILCGAHPSTLNQEKQTPLEVAKQGKKVFCEAYLCAVNGRDTFSRSSSEQSRASTVDGSDSRRGGKKAKPETEKPRHSEDKSWLSAWLSKGKIKTPDHAEKIGKQSTNDDEIPAVALYNHDASPLTPYPPDNRLELDLMAGQVVMVEQILPDGWAIVRKKGSSREGYVPGNFLSLDGKHTMVDESGLPYCMVCKRHRKTGHTHVTKAELHSNKHHHNLSRLMA